MMNGIRYCSSGHGLLSLSTMKVHSPAFVRASLLCRHKFTFFFFFGITAIFPLPASEVYGYWRHRSQYLHLSIVRFLGLHGSWHLVLLIFMCGLLTSLSTSKEGWMLHTALVVAGLVETATPLGVGGFAGGVWTFFFARGILSRSSCFAFDGHRSKIPCRL